MAFVDELTIHATAGRGGNGVVRWLHIKGKEKGGPAGGNGGRGGDIILEGVRDLGVLAAYRYTKKIRGEDGGVGGNNNKTGADGKPFIMKVPVGSEAINRTTQERFEILENGQQVRVFKGGPGGLGNAHFKSSVNQNPEEYTGGKGGGVGDIAITLKIIADAGFVGFPNAGKSSLLNALTRAQSKVGAYPFTTLDPHLGDFYGYLLADIPGLIGGASRGRGLGSKFLRHIERTKILVHLVSVEQEDPLAAYSAIRDELKAFGRGLEDKREIIVVSKTDLVDENRLKEIIADLERATGKEIWTITIADDDSIKEFSDKLTKVLTAPAEAE
ncbi:GTPase ObgE [Patescibacteria group bacterium]|nr:GTPase ObgE [Patescibacteria group bacterium]MBU1754918.1 GTPase ObgE [Patescibacteria group bacterium]